MAEPRAARLVGPALLLLLALIRPERAWIQDARERASPAGILKEARAALDEQNYDRAMRLFKEGKSLFPNTLEPALGLGDLYLEKELYNLALEEYRSAETLAPADRQVLAKIAHASGRLNREGDALAYYEKLVGLYPNDQDSLVDLAWWYFKTHQLRRGEALLLDGASRFGMQRHFAMTLGTIYAELFDYEKSEAHYRIAIEDALKEKRSYFASVAYYNLALLEKSFYHYDEALVATNRSLAQEERAPGHLVKGVIFMSRLDYPRALAEYSLAQGADGTPLSTINTAILNQKFGRLKEARAVIEDAARKKDHAWMYYFGINPRRHMMDLHEIRRDVYAGLARLEALKAQDSLPGRVAAFFTGLYYELLARHHATEFAARARVVAEDHFGAGDQLNGYFTLYRAERGHTAAALDNLRAARAIETARSPGSERFYNYELGRTARDPALLEAALAAFRDPWERDMQARALIELAGLYAADGRQDLRRASLWRLFDLNPGALRQNGLRLPVRLEVAAAGESGGLAACLAEAGFEIAAETDQEMPLLSVSLAADGSAEAFLAGGWSGKSRFAREQPPAGPRSPAELANLLAAKIFGEK